MASTWTTPSAVAVSNVLRMSSKARARSVSEVARSTQQGAPIGAVSRVGMVLDGAAAGSSSPGRGDHHGAVPGPNALPDAAAAGR